MNVEDVFSDPEFSAMMRKPSNNRSQSVVCIPIFGPVSSPRARGKSLAVASGNESKSARSTRSRGRTGPIIGVVQVVNKRVAMRSGSGGEKPAPFSAADEALLVEFAMHAGHAVEKMLAYETMKGDAEGAKAAMRELEASLERAQAGMQSEAKALKDENELLRSELEKERTAVAREKAILEGAAKKRLKEDQEGLQKAKEELEASLSSQWKKKVAGE